MQPLFDFFNMLWFVAHRDVPTFSVFLAIPLVLEAPLALLLFRRKFPLGEAVPTIIIGLIEVVLTGAGLYYLDQLFEAYRGFKLFQWDRTVVYWIGVCVASEFIFYAGHRVSHHVRWFWNEHRVHHSSQHMNLFVGNRNGWTQLIAGFWIFAVPFVFLGFEWRDLLWGIFLILNYQFFIHTELVPKLGPLEYILNTPARHRVHHAVQDPYLDKNFGGVTLIFDFIFGTAQAELPGVPTTYGLKDEASGGRNPVKIVLGGWTSMFHDVWTRPTLRAKAKALVQMKTPRA